MLPGSEATSTIPILVRLQDNYSGKEVVGIKHSILTAVCSFGLLSLWPLLGLCQDAIPNQKVPVIYSTDLWLPHGDPDDHFDLLSLFSLSRLDPKAIIIDHTMQSNVARTGIEKVPNFQVVEKAANLYSREVIPVRSGLKEPLKSIDDQGKDRPMEEQRAIKLVLQQLNAVAGGSAVIITTGSVRDIVAAFNRNPSLFKEKVKTIFISMGDSYGIQGTLDTNVAKDIEAWKGLLRSGLPISWMPTNPSKRRGGVSRYVSYWHFVQEELLTQSPKTIQEFFLSEGIPLALAAERPVRSMWSTPAFIEAAGLKCFKVGNTLKWLDSEQAKDSAADAFYEPYEFLKINLSVDDHGLVEWQLANPDEKTNFRIFKVNDYYLYNEAMSSFLRDSLDP